jgi:hypothetical protein
MQDVITGIQQVGIGVSDTKQAMYLYRDLFGMNVKVFDDKSAAPLMTSYTGNKVYSRHAILTMNLSCGGGFEIWQFTGRTPAVQPTISFGDIGIFAPKIRTDNIIRAHKFYKSNSAAVTSPIITNPVNQSSFWVKDVYGNFFQLVECLK